MNQLYRFHLAGNTVLAVGVFLGFFGSFWGPAWGIAAFAAGSLAAGLVAALVIAVHDSNEEIRADRAAVQAAPDEPGENIPWEKIKRDLGLNTDEDMEDQR